MVNSEIIFSFYTANGKQNEKVSLIQLMKIDEWGEQFEVVI